LPRATFRRPAFENPKCPGLKIGLDIAKAIVGYSDQLAARLKELVKSLELDELVVVTWTYDPGPRHRSYELLAQAFGLGQTEPRSA